MIFWNKFCGIVLFLMVTVSCSPAQSPKLPGINAVFVLKNKLNSSAPLNYMPLFPIVTNLQNVKQVVPADFYACNIGFFCKKELLIEKATRIPLRFRLGSLRQCNYYEGKKQ